MNMWDQECKNSTHHRQDLAPIGSYVVSYHTPGKIYSATTFLTGPSALVSDPRNATNACSTRRGVDLIVSGTAQRTCYLLSTLSCDVAIPCFIRAPAPVCWQQDQLSFATW